MTHIAGRDPETVRTIRALPLRALAGLMDKVIYEGKDPAVLAFLAKSGNRVPSQLWNFDPTGALRINVPANQHEPDYYDEDTDPAAPTMTHEEAATRVDEYIFKTYMQMLDDIDKMSADFKDKYLLLLIDRMTEIWQQHFHPASASAA